MTNYQEFKKQLLKNWRKKFWYYLYAPKYFFISIALRIRLWYEKVKNKASK